MIRKVQEEAATSQPPRLPRVTSTIAISRALRETMENAPAIAVLCAPRGFGKTSAVASWVRGQTGAHTRYVWVGLPMHATGPEQFWSEVHRALTGTSPPAGTDPLTLIYEVLGRTLQPTTLVLDNFTYVSDESVDDELGELLNQFERLRVVVMVRMERAIVAIANAHAESAVLRMPQLALDARGVATMATEAGYTMTRTQAREIAEAVVGWPAVIRALLRDGSRDADGALVPDWHGIERYCRIVLEDPDMQRFRPVLAALSCAQTFGPDLGRKLIGQDNWQTVFPVIHQAGIIDQVQSDSGQAYRIRPRLRAAVQAVTRRHDPVNYRHYHRILADWYDRRNIAEPAIAHFVEAEDWARAAVLVEDYWLEFVTGPTDEARRILRKFPDEIVRASAKLLVVRDYILNVDTRQRAWHAFRSGHMEADFAARYENQRLTLSQTLQMRVSGEYETFRQVIEQSGHGVERSAWADSVLEQMPEMLLQWSITLLLTRDVPSAAYVFRQAYQWARERGMTGAKREAGSGLALCLAMLGHLNSAEKWLDRVAGLVSRGVPADLERLASVLVRELIAGDRLEAGDTEPAAVEHVPALPGLEAIQQYLHAGYALHRGDARVQEETLSMLERSLATLTPHRHGARITGAAARNAIVDLCIARSQFERAYRVLEGVDAEQVWAIVCRARLALFEGRNDAVLTMTEHIDGLSVADIRHSLQLHLMRACAARRLHRMDVAGDELQAAASLAEISGIVRFFALVPRADLVGLDQEFPHVIPPGAVQAVTAGAEVFPEPREPVRLSERELEVLRQIATGAPLSQAARRLFVSENTVKSQVRNIYRKLGVHAREDALQRAKSLGLLTDDDGRPGESPGTAGAHAHRRTQAI
ncbi:LuxR C-terminal-related transcriptional regulator [Pseudactinotalea sp. Z1748]|uniref:helix-turn-helix transcriptional regulator n=1 Tax=Pseudactinotalea sp. Z1748 TaxID=3413027 RepID=UPI003C7EB3E1